MFVGFFNRRFLNLVGFNKKVYMQNKNLIIVAIKYYYLIKKRILYLITKKFIYIRKIKISKYQKMEEKQGVLK